MCSMHEQRYKDKHTETENVRGCYLFLLPAEETDEKTCESPKLHDNRLELNWTQHQDASNP